MSGLDEEDMEKVIKGLEGYKSDLSEEMLEALSQMAKLLKETFDDEDNFGLNLFCGVIYSSLVNGFGVDGALERIDLMHKNIRGAIERLDKKLVKD